ncbi:MAG: hypothetical protein EBS69_02150 [Verrucomicrobia bacterium]|nr:hypothetical protein [Verrucomicrobiota bacterium]
MARNIGGGGCEVGQGVGKKEGSAGGAGSGEELGKNRGRGGQGAEVEFFPHCGKAGGGAGALVGASGG